MDRFVLIVFGIMSVLLLVGCTQAPGPDTNKQTPDISIQLPDENPIEPPANDTNRLANDDSAQPTNDNTGASLKSRFCTDYEYGWRCIIDKNALNDDAVWESITDTLMTECLLVENAQSSGSGSEGRQLFYCDFMLPDSRKSCNSSKECIGYCQLTFEFDTKYSSDFFSTEPDYKQPCAECKGECSQTMQSNPNDGSTDWVNLENGYLVHAVNNMK